MAISPDHNIILHTSILRTRAVLAAYQVSGYPYITGSTTLANSGEDKLAFPGVTKSITVINRLSGSGDAPDIRVHFAPSLAAIEWLLVITSLF
jgi:hypothetical protein